VANRDKDRDFNRALLREGIVHADTALKRLHEMPLSEPERERLRTRIRRMAVEARRPEAP
jgi:hypothetical protein